MNILSSMWGRVFSVLMVGMVSSTALTGWLAFGERERTLMQYRVSHNIERTEQMARALDVLPTSSREQFWRQRHQWVCRLPPHHQKARLRRLNPIMQKPLVKSWEKVSMSPHYQRMQLYAHASRKEQTYPVSRVKH